MNVMDKAQKSNLLKYPCKLSENFDRKINLNYAPTPKIKSDINFKQISCLHLPNHMEVVFRLCCIGTGKNPIQIKLYSQRHINMMYKSRNMIVKLVHFVIPVRNYKPISHTINQIHSCILIRSILLTPFQCHQTLWQQVN